MDTKTTYQKIAQLTDVSIATVSRVINAPHLVNQATCQKVMNVMKELDCEYLLKDSPKSKVLSSRMLFVISIPDVGNPFYTSVLEGMKSASESNNYDFILHDGPITTENMHYFLRLLKRVKASGVIVLQYLDKKVLERINAIAPVVQCSEMNPDCDLPYVTINNSKSAEMAVDYMLFCGCKRIALINGNLSSYYARERQRGYENALRRAGIKVRPELILNLSQSRFTLAASAISNQLQRSGEQPDSFFCTCDMYAVAAIYVCHERNLSIPGDVQVVGFDNLDYSIMTAPKLTTVMQPSFDMGVIAFDILSDQLSSNSTSSRQVTLNTELVIRESTRGTPS